MAQMLKSRSLQSSAGTVSPFGLVSRGVKCRPCRPVVLPRVATDQTVINDVLKSMDQSVDVPVEEDPRGVRRVKYVPEGYNFWQWKGRRVHYLQAGTEGPPVILVHGYGASAYHWRYTVPALAQHYKVYAVCLLGFGWSEKARVDYSNGKVWVEQISDFIKEVVGGDEPVVLAGNSLGGYAALATAAARPDLVRGLALLNSAGPLEDPTKLTQEMNPWWQPIKDTATSLVKRVVLFFAFQRARQPERIREVLQMVYVDRDSIDEDLVDSIVRPALDPAASEVFFLVNNQRGPSLTVNSLLKQLNCPVLLLWGDKDPWITSNRAQRMMDLYPRAKKVGLESGHCPHDDTPLETNSALLHWLSELDRGMTA